MPKATNNPLREQKLAVYAEVAHIPKGSVTTYGRIATIVGCTPRTVGVFMKGLPHHTTLPWHRVVNTAGVVRNEMHRQKLVGEGIGLLPSGRIDMRAYLVDSDPPN